MKTRVCEATTTTTTTATAKGRKKTGNTEKQVSHHTHSHFNLEIECDFVTSEAHTRALAPATHMLFSGAAESHPFTK